MTAKARCSRSGATGLVQSIHLDVQLPAASITMKTAKHRHTDHFGRCTALSKVIQAACCIQGRHMCPKSDVLPIKSRTPKLLIHAPNHALSMDFSDSKVPCWTTQTQPRAWILRRNPQLPPSLQQIMEPRLSAVFFKVGQKTCRTHNFGLHPPLALQKERERERQRERGVHCFRHTKNIPPEAVFLAPGQQLGGLRLLREVQLRHHALVLARRGIDRPAHMGLWEQPWF